MDNKIAELLIEYEKVRQFEALRRIGSIIVNIEDRDWTDSECDLYDQVLLEMERVYSHSENVKNKIKSENPNLVEIFKRFDKQEDKIDAGNDGVHD